MIAIRSLNCISTTSEILVETPKMIVKNCKFLSWSIEVEKQAAQMPFAVMRCLDLMMAGQMELRLFEKSSGAKARCAGRAGMGGASSLKNEIAPLSTEAESSAISKSYEPPKRFVRWQPGLAKHKLPICIPTSIGGRCFPVGTRPVSVNSESLARSKICFHKSHVPCGTWCL